MKIHMISDVSWGFPLVCVYMFVLIVCCLGTVALFVCAMISLELEKDREVSEELICSIIILIEGKESVCV
jgi:hypothetical protein